MTREKGFTLLETLVVLVLMSLLVLALFGGFRAGVSSWRVADTHVAEHETSRQLALMLRRQMRQLMVTPIDFFNRGSTFGFTGDAQRVQYIAPLALSVGEAPYVIELSSSELGGEGVWIRYALYEEGLELADTLADVEPEQVSDSVTLTFSYFIDDEWVERMPEARYPKLIRVHFSGEQRMPDLTFAVAQSEY